MMWQNIDINSNQIEHETNKAFLIKLLGKRQAFWLSKKFVHVSTTKFANIGINTEYSYLLSNKQTMSGESILEYFSLKEQTRIQNHETFYENTPNRIEPKEVKPDDSLLR